MRTVVDVFLLDNCNRGNNKEMLGKCLSLEQSGQVRRISKVSVYYIIICSPPITNTCSNLDKIKKPTRLILESNTHITASWKLQ